MMGAVTPLLVAVRIVTDSSLTEPVTRTWRERWLSWPWRPWARVKLVPSRTYYIVDGVPGGPKTLVCHPSLAAEFERALAELELQTALEQREGGKWWS
jgi:hypothetical protein